MENAKTSPETWALLDKASKGGSLAFIASLLADGADPNAADVNHTALGLAAAGKNRGFGDADRSEIVGLLLEAGADPGGRGPFGEPPLCLAAKNENGALSLLMLLEAGAEPDARDRLGHSALHNAAWGGNVEMASLLIEAGANVAAANSVGGAPLHSAAGGGSAELCSLLLAAGADPLAVDKEGRTAADMAKGDAVGVMRAATEAAELAKEASKGAAAGRARRL